MIQRDGLRFLGQIKDCGVEQEQCRLVGPLNREAPSSKYLDAAEKVECLTVTQADLGCWACFLNFKPVFREHTVFPMMDWDNTLDWILSFYGLPDLLAMNDAMAHLPKEAGSKASRAVIYNKLCIAYYRNTGLDWETKKAPKGQTLDWLTEQTKKDDARRATVTSPVAKRSSSSSS